MDGEARFAGPRESISRTICELGASEVINGRLLGVTTCVVLLLSATAAAASRSHVTSCRGGFNTDGSKAQFGFYRQITQRGTNCVQARAVVHGYVSRLHGVAGSLDGKRVHVGTYLCRTSVTADADKITCSASRGRRVTFVGAP
jgi:hypothetical protein